MVNRKLKMSIAKEEEEELLLKKYEDKDEGGQQYQSQFHLLQLNDDCLLLLFTQMTILQAFELGITCRRLYGLYRDSLANRRSLLIYKYKIFCNNKYLPLFDQQSPAEAADSLPHLVPEVDHLNIPKYEPSVICHLLTCMPGLVSLEIRNVTATEFCQMVATLNRSQAKLQSLKLDVIDFSRGEQMELLQLELPSLKHLSLWADENSSEFLLCNPIFLTVMPQLTSFQLYIINAIEKSWYLSTVLPFIGKHVYSNAQLVAAARSGSANLNVSFKINSLFFWGENDNDPTEEEAACLELITSLEAIWFEDPMTESFIHRLSLMRSLRRLIIIPCTMEDSYSTVAPPLPYRRLFNALVNTPLLEVLKLDFCGDTWFSELFLGHFNKADFPVLPTVRSFSLLYRTFEKDDNPIRVFQLEHIFPGLTELNLTFVQDECSVCDCFNGGLKPVEHNFPGLKEVSVAYELNDPYYCCHRYPPVFNSFNF